jgi:hypothetical protein
LKVAIFIETAVAVQAFHLSTFPSYQDPWLVSNVDFYAPSSAAAMRLTPLRWDGALKANAALQRKHTACRKCRWRDRSDPLARNSNCARRVLNVKNLIDRSDRLA